MGKKKKKSGLPTTNRFWSQIGNQVGKGNHQKLQNNMLNQNSGTELKDLTQDTSPANPMEKLPASTSNTPSNTEGQQDDSQSPSIAQAPKIYFIKTDNTAGAQEGPVVVEGTAADIKLVVNKLKSTATPQPKKSSPRVIIGLPKVEFVKEAAQSGKPIQSRITQKAVPRPNPRSPIVPVQTQLTPIKKTTPLLTTPIQQPKKNETFVPAISQFAYPKGIPKSFLMRPSAETPEPYFNISRNQASGSSASLPNVSSTQEDWMPNKISNWEQIPPPSSIVQSFDAVDQSETPTPVETEKQSEQRQAYSPSDMYNEQFFTGIPNESHDELESPEQIGQKRPSAFDRLGPLAEPPKKPKLTINLLCNSEQSVREVVDETEAGSEKTKYVPVHLRKDILNSTDETVKKFLPMWPWKKNIAVRKSVTARNSKSVMILEREQMEEHYDKDNMFIQVSVKGYPTSWNKENVLDAILEVVKGKIFIPCFTDFSPTQCRFLVIRNRIALSAIHKMGFFIRKDGVELSLTISMIDISLSHLDLIPRLVLRKRLSMAYDGEKSLDLSNFTTKEDISHFIYYPLNQTTNQSELIYIQSTIAWQHLTELNLSHNRITCLDGFKLETSTPKLKHLDLSFNYIEQIISLLRLRNLGLRTIKLEGNPLCNDFVDPSYYVKVLKTMFPALIEIDGEKVHLKGDMPAFKKNYCPESAMEIIEKFLETFFPLLDSTEENRAGIRDMYHENACLTVTFKYKLRYDPTFRTFRSLFNHSRILEEGDTDSVDGAVDISKLICKWPPTKHDPVTFTVDVFQHDEFVTMFKVCGIVKLTAETLAEDEYMLAFSRTFVLNTNNGWEYKIANEMVYWDFPTQECSNNAFRVTTVKPKKLSVAIESPPPEDLKEKLIDIFMQLSNLNKKASERCLELNNWNLKQGLDNFIKLLKLDDLETLYQEIQ